MKYLRVDKYVLSHANRRSVLDCILYEGPINKAAIAQKVGLSIPSVMKIVDSFIQSGLVRSIGKGPSSGGKPPELLEIAADACYAVGVDVGLSQLRILVGDLGGRIVARHSEATGSALNVEKFIDRLCAMIEGLLTRAEVDRSRVLGVGIAMPGLIDVDAGCVLFSPDIKWENVPLVQEIMKRLPYPVHIENVTMVIARAEYFLGAGRGGKYIMQVNLGHGIGGAIIQNGEIYYGSGGTSGEIGHITVNRDGPLCMCGNYGCLEAMASGEAIARQGRDLISRGVPSRILEFAGGHVDLVDAKVVFDAARAGDEPARQIVERAIEYIGIALGAAINMLDLDRIVVSGGLTKNGDIFWNKLRPTLSKRQMKYAGRDVQLVQSRLGDDAAALGAIYQVVQEYILSQ